LILPLFGWRSLSVYAWAKDDGEGSSESVCVDTLTWVDEWWAYTYTYQGISQTDTSVIISRGLTANGHHHFFKLDRLFENADSIYIDSIQALYHWGGTANDSDTVVFSIDTLKPVNSNNHYFYSVKYTYLQTGTATSTTLTGLGMFRSPSFVILRLYKRTGSHGCFQHGFVVFYKKYR